MVALHIHSVQALSRTCRRPQEPKTSEFGSLTFAGNLQSRRRGDRYHEKRSILGLCALNIISLFHRIVLAALFDL
jgi:hypothetical protein